MQVTIDSSESLDEVLSVLSTMFDTRIVTDPAGAATASSPAESAAAGKPAPKAGRVKAANSVKRSASASSSVDTATVRAWARDQGRTVSKRGALPKSLIAEYQAAHA